MFHSWTFRHRPRHCCDCCNLMRAWELPTTNNSNNKKRQKLDPSATGKANLSICPNTTPDPHGLDGVTRKDSQTQPSRGGGSVQTFKREVAARVINLTFPPTQFMGRFMNSSARARWTQRRRRRNAHSHSFTKNRFTHSSHSTAEGSRK